MQETAAERKRSRAKLTREQRDAIRIEAPHWPLRVLVKRYGVCVSTIRDVLSGKSWADENPANSTS